MSEEPAKSETAQTGGCANGKGLPKSFQHITKGVALACAVGCIVNGALGLISFSGLCIAAAIIQMLIGSMIFVLEAPCFCAWIDCIDHIDKFSSSRPPWQKAVGYALVAFIPVILCIQLTTILGCVSIVIAAMFYGIQAIGRRGSDATTSNAAPPTNTNSESIILVEK